MQYELNYHGERLVIQRNPPTKRMKRLRLNVHQDLRITISAPKRTSDKAIQQFINHHADWLYQQFSRVKANYRPPPQYHYHQGELHWFVGERYPLLINPSKQEMASSPIQIMVKMPIVDKETIKNALWRWYKKQAFDYFSKRVGILSELTPWVDSTPQIKTRKMKRQWGNCADCGHITLNTHLIKAPSNCIDYVILHELCHLQEFNHSAKFYQLMNQVMPDWREQKSQLAHLTSQLLIP